MAKFANVVCERPLVAISFLLSSQFYFLYKYIKKEITRSAKLLEKQPLQSISCKQQKSMYIAMLLYQGDQEGIETLMEKQIETHGNEGKALCCLKVKVSINLK